jgi:uncharacterized protein
MKVASKVGRGAAGVAISRGTTGPGLYGLRRQAPGRFINRAFLRRPAVMIAVRASTPIRPSENPKKVEKAMRTLFPTSDLVVENDGIVVSTDSLKSLRDLIWKNKILDAARRILLGSLSQDGRRSRFDLSKQAAYAGTLSFAVGQAPLGDITVEIEGDDLEALFKEIAPPTLSGRPVTEEQFEAHLEKRRKARVVREKVDKERLATEFGVGVKDDEDVVAKDEAASIKDEEE